MQALLSELAEHSDKVEDLKKTLKQLIKENPDSPEAETWKQQLKDIGQSDQSIAITLNRTAFTFSRYILCFMCIFVQY